MPWLSGSKNIELRGELKLHGKTAPVVFKVIVTKRSDESFHAATSSPAFISANSFELAPGIGKLRSLAGLQNIDLVVPVTFLGGISVKNTRREISLAAIYLKSRWV